MKEFLIKIFIFSATLVIAAFAIDYCVANGLKKTEQEDIKTWNDIFASRINSDVIIVGSSRAKRHYDTKILDDSLNVNSYNLGINGYPFSMSDVQFRIYEKYNKIPKLIIINTDRSFLGRRNEAFNRYQFLPYLNEPLLRKELINIDGFSKSDFYINGLKYYGEYPAIFLGLSEFFKMYHIPPETEKGYKGENLKWNGDGFKKALLGDSIVANINLEIVQLFDKFLNHCINNNIKVVMVYSPEYYKVTEFTKNFGELMNIYHSFSEKYNIPLLDYSTDTLCYDATYFYNAMHLNKKGADIFSTKLAHDIDSLEILK